MADRADGGRGGALPASAADERQIKTARPQHDPGLSLSLFVFEYVLFYSVHPKLPSLGRAGIQLQAAAAVARKEAIKHTTMDEEDNWS